MRETVIVSTPRPPVGRAHESAMGGHALTEGRRPTALLVVVTMCIGGGIGAADLSETA